MSIQRQIRSFLNKNPSDRIRAVKATLRQIPRSIYGTIRGRPLRAFIRGNLSVPKVLDSRSRLYAAHRPDPDVDYHQHPELRSLSQYGRPVGPESRKTFDAKLESGFWQRYITGPDVLDIGFRGGGAEKLDVVPIVEGAIGVDMDYPGYDGRTLPFATNSQDAVYSSHCLEHIPHYNKAIQEWYRVTKVGGHIITVVPNSFLYERKRTPPSRWNGDHQRFYTPSSLLAEFERALLPNSYRVRHLVENDANYSYLSSPNEHPLGCYEIELVIQKIELPLWKLSD